MKRFRIETIEGDLLMHITLHHPPYEDENVLSRTKLKPKDVKITEIKQYQGEE